MNLGKLSILGGVCLLCTALSSVGAQEEADFLTEDDLFDDDFFDTVEISDPLEPFNRAVFSFNDFVYLNVLDPVSDAYTKVVPDPVERGLGNFFRNLRFPVRFVSNVVQGDFDTARIESERFIVNTTAGLGGFKNAADRIEGLERPAPQTIASALGAYGMGEGFYIVIPFVGPSTTRDALGILGNRTVSPWHKPYTVIDDEAVRISLDAVEFVNASPRLLDAYQAATDNAFDPYSSVKNAYVQSSRQHIRPLGLAQPNHIIRARRR